MFTRGRLEDLFQHLVLPAHIRHVGRDTFIANDLARILQEACHIVSTAGQPAVWEAVTKAIQATHAVHRTESHNESVADALRQLAHASQHDSWLALHVAKQNAGLLIHKDQSSIAFESFQLAAPAAKVLEATHALAWDFPDRSAAIPLETFTSESFISAFSSFIDQSTKDAYDRFAARANIGGRTPVVETRDCPSPALITDMLMSLLEGLGGPVDILKQHQIRKKVRDDVVHDKAEVPWRRSPYWLLLRVFLQRLLSSTLSEAEVSAGVHTLYFKFIVATVLARFVELAAGQLHPAKVTTLVAKLARRLAKLETARSASVGIRRAALDELFGKTEPYLSQVITGAQKGVSDAWEGFKRKIIRHVPPNLPRFSYPSEHRLKLTNSISKLNSLLSSSTRPIHALPSRHLAFIPEGTVAQIRTLAKLYTDLHDLETKMTDETQTAVLDEMSAQEKCCLLGRWIIKYLDHAATTYRGDSSLMSRCLLRVFEQWMAMDKAVMEICPFLKDYHPIFVPEALDVLCFLSYAEMKRLRRVQDYLGRRIGRCRPAVGTIFNDVASVESFPAQFIRCTPEGKRMARSGEMLDRESDLAREATLADLRDLMESYTRLSMEMELEICTCTYLADGTKIIDGCVRCFKRRERNRLEILVHEEYLPDAATGRALRSAILLELHLPKFFRYYREATWKLVLLGADEKVLSKVRTTEDNAPKMTIKNFDRLWPLRTAGKMRSGLTPLLTLASIKKSVLSTHYRSRKLPVSEAEVALPFRSQFNYYDEIHRVWTTDMEHHVPGFEHLMGSWIPYPDLIKNPYENVKDLLRNDGTYAPSSYAIAASEPQCPPHLSAQEISAFQRAVSGRGRRWIVMLVELGATNISFSGEAAMGLLSHLALQAGPATQQQGVLREAHIVFADPKFCTRLYEQLSVRLTSISASWREVHYINIIITFTLRLYQLGPTSAKSLARQLLSEARDVLKGWIVRLRDDVRTTQDPDVAQKAASYAFHASLLSRRVFYGSLRSDGNVDDDGIGEEDMRCYLRATIAMQEHLVVDIEKLTPVQKQLLRYDLYESYRLREQIKELLLVGGGMSSLQQVINETWTDAGITEGRTYGTWAFCSEQDGWWLANEVSSSSSVAVSRPQVVHFHLLQGHLLIDGKPLGRLPLSMREDDAIKELFGNQYLLTRPSGLPGMEYQLVHSVMDHQIHFGSASSDAGRRQGGGVVIQALYRGQRIQHVKRDIFKDAVSRTVDLPLPLVDDCVHWINLETGQMEMRRRTDIWKRKASHWVLDVRRKVASRHNGGSVLVEPQSPAGERIAGVFAGFEDSNRLTIFQPTRGPVRVEMKRLELSFYVNNRRRLQSDQLRCEVDPNQDAGTWYGLRSGILIRDVYNPASRSILVPHGSLSWTRSGMHVAVHISNNGEYLRYSIDEVLGKLDCASEPVLLYLKASLHALTSFHLPDPLTNRTGTEEAVSCLNSSAYQPWAPLGMSATQRLLDMKNAVPPHRAYYPADRKLYQRVTWDDNLTPTIQHEAIGHLVDCILVQSRQLTVLSTTTRSLVATDHHSEEQHIEQPMTDHLPLRGLIRRHLYERSLEAVDAMIPREALEPLPFNPRGGGGSTTKEAHRVYSLMKSLKLTAKTHSSFKLEPLQQLLQNKSVIGAFTTSLSSTLSVHSLLDVNVPLLWGSLVEMCRRGHPLVDFGVCFALAVVAFGRNVDTKLVSWLAAIATSEELQAPEPPSLKHTEPFREYKGSEIPSRDMIESLVLHGQSTRVVQPAPTEGNLPVRGKRNHRRGQRQEEPPRTILVPPSPAHQDEASRLAYHLLTWMSTRTELLQEDFNYLAEEAECHRLNLESAWVALQPELRRVSDNTELHTYVAELDSLARRDNEKVLLNFNLKPHTTVTQFEPRSAHEKAFYSLPSVGGLSLRKPTNADETDEKSSDLYHADGVMRNEVTAEREDKKMASSLVWQEQQNPLQSDAADSPATVERTEEAVILEQLVAELTTSSDGTRQKYGQDLQLSLEALARDEISFSTARAGSREKEVMTEEQAAAIVMSAQETLEAQTKVIHTLLAERASGHNWLQLGSLWPCVSHVSLLSLLRTDNFRLLGQHIKEEMIKYGLLLTDLQRLLRLQDAILHDQNSKALEEQRHEGHSNWKPISNPEWLLIEIDNNILIRPAQVDVARAIISPASGANSVLQMNMGQGKTSCIMPMAFTALADKKKLCRIIVPRALLQQTAQVMQSRLGGLVGRVVKHVPFSRRTPTSKAFLTQYRDLHASCLMTGGVMLCLPEHVMSFKLSGLQRLADGKPEVAQVMTGLQEWLDNSCRDILDESDFTLSVRTQLVYPSGPQTAVDSHPYRWRIAEELLELVGNHVAYLESTFPDGIHVVRRDQGGFPILHFLHAEVEDSLQELLIDDICSGKLSLLELKPTSALLDAVDVEQETQKQDLRAILTSGGVPLSAAAWEKAARHTADSVSGPKNLLLLRGLISENILLLCLKKRWNVHYGIHPSRAPIAVPFEAKGIPSETAEYGHPDTAIMLTCLAFYHIGLSMAQVERSLKHVFQMADPAVGYEAWIQSCHGLPAALRHWNLVNTDDVEQVGELWHHLHLDRGVINHFLNTFVFPVHAKQFTFKLQASGWDIPLFAKDEEKQKRERKEIKETKQRKKMLDEKNKETKNETKLVVRSKDDRKRKTVSSSSAADATMATTVSVQQGNRRQTELTGATGAHVQLEMDDSPRMSLTTGFSGTNDNKRMLPDTIRQDDLPSLLQTNAQVLQYLLEDRNRVCLQAADFHGRNLSEKGLLELLRVKGIRVLIDSGAYILEMENEAVATAWLEIDHEAKGAVYFGKDNKILVRAKFMKHPMPLLASPFAENLEECVVYIDEAHTRGTDLKLPPMAKGALTLGLGQTKDHTVQGAMRLRQLGTKQSVCFIAPPEVYQSILALQRQNRNNDGTSMFKDSKRSRPERDSRIDSADVLRWLLEQSCKANDQMMPLHLTQGADFCRQTEAKWRYADALTDRGQRAQLLQVIRQEEDQTLEQLYGPKKKSLPTTMTDVRTGASGGKSKSAKLRAVTARIDEKRAILMSKPGGAASGEGSAFQEVEQEREVEFEVEQVRQREKPNMAIALAFPGLDKDIVHFVETGELVLTNDGFLQAFAYLGETTVGKKFGIQGSRSRLFVSKQFSKTVVVTKGRSGGDQEIGTAIRRPVEWILWSALTGTALIVIPEEAELLLPRLRDTEEEPKARLLSYAAPVTRTMCQFSRLGYYVIPSVKRSALLQIPEWLSIEVGIVSGRLYFAWSEYDALMAWIGKESSGPEQGSRAISKKSACGLSTTETRKFLLEWLTLCHQLHNVHQTPVGFVCQGRELQPGHSFFIDPTLVDRGVPGVDGQDERTQPSRYHLHTSKTRVNLSDDDDDSEQDMEWMNAEEGDDFMVADEDQLSDSDYLSSAAYSLREDSTDDDNY